VSAPPPHHAPDGRFRNPWSVALGDDALRARIWRVAFEWIFGRHPPDPSPEELGRASPDPARPRVADAGDVRITWIGHATTLIQLPGLNLLTDPVWSDRCSPLGMGGPKRFTPPGMELSALPPVDAVLLSHDHYDHLDKPTVQALRDHSPEAVWLTPLAYRRWFVSQGVEAVVERDWWEAATLPGGRFEAVSVPARHWTRRRPGATNTRLWCGWVVRPVGGASAPRVYFAGDSGYCPAFEEIGSRLGPFDVSLVPIGAYEPRWFMAAWHVSPEEAVRAYQEAGGCGAFVGIHWGTWRLTFESPLEPPGRTRSAWAAAGLAPGDLHIPRHGETVRVRYRDEGRGLSPSGGPHGLPT